MRNGFAQTGVHKNRSFYPPNHFARRRCSPVLRSGNPGEPLNERPLPYKELNLLVADKQFTRLLHTAEPLFRRYFFFDGSPAGKEALLDTAPAALPDLVASECKASVARLLSYCGKAERGLGNVMGAVQCLERALALEDDNPHILRQVSELCHTIPDHQIRQLFNGSGESADEKEVRAERRRLLDWGLKCNLKLLEILNVTEGKRIIKSSAEQADAEYFKKQVWALLDTAHYRFSLGELDGGRRIIHYDQAIADAYAVLESIGVYRPDESEVPSDVKILLSSHPCRRTISAAFGVAGLAYKGKGDARQAINHLSAACCISKNGFYRDTLAALSPRTEGSKDCIAATGTTRALFVDPWELFWDSPAPKIDQLGGVIAKLEDEIRATGGAESLCRSVNRHKKELWEALTPNDGDTTSPSPRHEAEALRVVALYLAVVRRNKIDRSVTEIVEQLREVLDSMLQPGTLAHQIYESQNEDPNGVKQ